jgi:Cft2 family RNA processing exonuclease
LYTEEESLRALDRFRSVPWRLQIDLGDGLRATFLPVGHLLGASMILLEDREHSILFTGDVGRPRDLLLWPPDAPPAARVLVTESTYGNRDHVDSDPSLVLADVIRRTAHRGGAVIMPTFCVGRVQEVMLLLARLKASGGMPDLPIYLDSPMAIDATALYVRYHGEHRLDQAQAEAMSGVAHIVRTVEESKRVTAWAPWSCSRAVAWRPAGGSCITSRPSRRTRAIPSCSRGIRRSGRGAVTSSTVRARSASMATTCRSARRSPPWAICPPTPMPPS